MTNKAEKFLEKIENEIAVTKQNEEIVAKVCRTIKNSPQEDTFHTRIVQRLFVQVASHGCAKIIGMMLKENKQLVHKVDDHGNTALIEASRHGHTRVVTLLLQANADIERKNNSNNTALHVACEQGQSDVVAKLISNKATLWTPGFQGKQPLHLAAGSGHEKVVKQFLAIGERIKVFINDTDGIGQTPLLKALCGRHFDVAMQLGQRGCKRQCCW